MCVVCACGFFLVCGDSGRLLKDSFPACAFFFFFKVEIRLRTLLPLLGQDQSTMAQQAEMTVAESWDSLLVEHQTCDRMVASSNPGRNSRRIFFSRVNFVCWFLFSDCSTPLLLQWHIKYPGHSTKSACGRLHLNTHTPLTQWSQSGLTILLCRHSVGTCQEQAHTQLNNITERQTQPYRHLHANKNSKH